MNKVNGSREAGHLLTQPERDAILGELEHVLASPHFCNSKRYPALLQYAVENALAGRSDLLKERTLGVEVFDRPPAYDTSADTVVRYTAGEVRKRLQLYYHEEGRRSPIRISLPAGSYVPEFLSVQPETGGDHGLSEATNIVRAELTRPTSPPLHNAMPQRADMGRRWYLTAAVLVALVAMGAWRYHSVRPLSAIDDFWQPVLRDQHPLSICTGSSVFAEGNFSGVATAGKDTEYPFVSMQTASAIAQISDLLGRSGATTELQSCASTQLTALREHPVILLGGYNNQWTMRLLQPFRFYIGPETLPGIFDRTQPKMRWARDPSLPYSSADDYGLIARFRDSTTDSWVVVLAGLGRNGTEAAAQFATSPRYLQILRSKLGSDFGNRNLEAIVKVSVIEGKTGAPSLVEAHVW